MSFNLKLFFTFVIFGIFLALFSVYSFSKISDEKQLLKKIEITHELISRKETQISKFIYKLDNHLQAISKNNLFKQFMEDGSHKEYIEGLFEMVTNTVHGIVQTKYIDSNGVEIVVVNTSAVENYLNLDKTRQHELNKYYFNQTRKQKIGETWHSRMGINMEKRPLDNPIKPLIVMGINTGYGVLEFYVDLGQLNDILTDKRYQLLLADIYGNIIIDSNDKLSWSYYLDKDVDLKTILKESNNEYLNYNTQKTDTYVSIKLSSLNNDDATLILLYPDFETLIDKEKYYVYITILLSTTFLAILLAYLFSKPMSRMTARIEKLNTKLDKQVEKRTQELNESLRIIDKYVIRSVTDTNGVIISASEAFCKVSKFTKDELIGQTHSLIRHPDMKDDIFKEMWETIKSGKSWDGKIKNKIKGGSYYWVEAHIEPNYLDGKIISYTAIRSDITSKVKLEELNKSLEKKIEEEVDKSTKQLEQIQKEQLKSVKLSTIGTLAAGITHEINTPLTYIKGNFELIRYDMEDLPPSELKERMLEDSEMVIDGINRIANIIEAMKEVSQTSCEIRENVNIYNTLMTALIISNNNSKQISKIYINNKQFTLDFAKDEFEFFSMVQKQRIEQVWIILINNALDELAKYEPYEDRRLDINIEEQNGNIVVEFHDNAGGIDEDLIAKIFEPFVSTKKSGGMGIGLNVAKKIIDEHQGIIIAKNVGDGALFRIEFISQGK